MMRLSPQGERLRQALQDCEVDPRVQTHFSEDQKAALGVIVGTTARNISNLLREVRMALGPLPPRGEP